MNRIVTRLILIFIVSTLLFLIADPSSGIVNDTRAVNEINWEVISSGGTAGYSSIYQLNGTAGQTAVGKATSTSYILKHGFWQDFGSLSGPCDCEPGNANNDETINIFDITYIINYLYREGSAPIPYALCNGDPNKDCVCNIFDITFLIGYLYLEGPPPATCEEWAAACGGLQKK